MPELKHVIIHSDGGCEGNPGPGGWAAVLEFGCARKEISGGELATTNNRMELRAAIEALACLKEPCAVDFYTDSEYVREGITAWIAGWKARRWRTAERKPVKNADLWRRLDELAAATPATPATNAATSSPPRKSAKSSPATNRRNSPPPWLPFANSRAPFPISRSCCTAPGALPHS